MERELQYVTEQQTPYTRLSFAVDRILYDAQSEFQHIQVAESRQFGRMLILDGVFQTSLGEEWVYHEMIAHVPLTLHPNPKRVLVIGGGDGGSVREVLRHPSVERVDLVEIDGEVVRVAKEYFPQISAALLAQPDRLHVEIGDGIAHVKATRDTYDVIIVDCSDPIGPGEGLFTQEFYAAAAQALKEDGILVQQTESPFMHRTLVHDVFAAFRTAFPLTRLYLAAIPIYPSGLHCFTLGSKRHDPLTTPPREVELGRMHYYNPAVARAAFMLPEFVKRVLKGETE